MSRETGHSGANACNSKKIPGREQEYGTRKLSRFLNFLRHRLS